MGESEGKTNAICVKFLLNAAYDEEFTMSNASRFTWKVAIDSLKERLDVWQNGGEQSTS